MEILFKLHLFGQKSTTLMQFPWNGWILSIEVSNALQAASIGDHHEIVRVLLNSGVELEHIDVALDSVFKRGKKYITDLLLQYKAKQK